MREREAFGGQVKGDWIRFRGLTFGGYDTRRSFAMVNGFGVDLSGMNKILTEQKLPPFHGLLGNLDLLSGSAVIDFGTNTLYLRPVKATLWPQLEGKWVGVTWESDGQKGQHNPGDGSVEFKDGWIRFTTPGGETKEWGFHLRDEGDRYRVGLFNPKIDELADDFKYSRHGLLKLAEGKLTLVIQQDAGKEPTEFAAPKGSGLLLVECKRAR
jgi:hypothetical protein